MPRSRLGIRVTSYDIILNLYRTHFMHFKLCKFRYILICSLILLILDDQKCVILLAIRLNHVVVFINGIYSLSCFT